MYSPNLLAFIELYFDWNPNGWDGTGMNCYGVGWDGTEKYVPRTSLYIIRGAMYPTYIQKLKFLQNPAI